MHTQKILPSVLTFSNISLGFISLYLVAEGYGRAVVTLVILAMVLDGLDGHVARLFEVSGSFGKELDSLADIVSFGAVPAFFFWYQFGTTHGVFAAILSVFFLLCGAYRLARFNVDPPGKPGFTGLPITIAGGALVLLTHYGGSVHLFILSILSLVLAFLMVSEVPYNSMKGLELLAKSYWLGVLAVGMVLILVFPFLLMGLLLLYIAGGVLGFFNDIPR